MGNTDQVCYLQSNWKQNWFREVKLYKLSVHPWDITDTGVCECLFLAKRNWYITADIFCQFVSVNKSFIILDSPVFLLLISDTEKHLIQNLMADLQEQKTVYPSMIFIA